jgi:hypothetical protein
MSDTGFLNTGMRGQPEGYDCSEDHVQARWYAPDVMIYRFVLDPIHPLTFITPNGIHYQPGKLFFTDKGTIPWFVQWIAPDDRFIGFAFHDFAYKYGYLWGCLPERDGNRWHKHYMTRKQADDLLRLMLAFDPYPASTTQEIAIYRGVRAFGWVAWGKKVKELPRPPMALPIALS